MMTAAPIIPVQILPATPLENGRALSPSPVPATSFSQMLVDGVDRLNGDILQADKLAQSFVLDDNVPIHEVTYALSSAKLSLELAMQIRGRLVEAYQQLMNMQL